MEFYNVEEIKKKYELSEEEFQNMYKQAKELIIGNCQPSNTTPTAIVTGGQPGAGKIGLVLKSKKDLSNLGEDVVVIDSDIYRGLYKNAMKIAERYPELYSEITDKATGRITKMLLAEVMEKGYNFIFEGTMGKLNIIESLKEAPVEFNVIVRLIATSREESLLSVFERYILMIQNMGIGRFATIKAHDSRYESFTENAKILENKDVEVEVYERAEEYDKIEEPKLLYKTSSKENKYKSVYEALIEGRKNSFNKCKNMISTRLNAINEDLEMLNQNNPKFKEEVKKLNNIFYMSIKQEREEEK